MNSYSIIVTDNQGSVFMVHVEAVDVLAASAIAEKGRGKAVFVFVGHLLPLGDTP